MKKEFKDYDDDTIFVLDEEEDTLYIRATSSYVSDSNLSRKLVLEISTDNKTWKTVASNQFKADVSRSVAYTYSQ